MKVSRLAAIGNPRRRSASPGLALGRAATLEPRQGFQPSALRDERPSDGFAALAMTAAGAAARVNRTNVAPRKAIAPLANIKGLIEGAGAIRLIDGFETIRAASAPPTIFYCRRSPLTYTH